jgi:hypothetical protein
MIDDQSIVTHEVVLTGLLGATAWNLITWYYATACRSHRRMRSSAATPAPLSLEPARR